MTEQTKRTHCRNCGRELTARERSPDYHEATCSECRRPEKRVQKYTGPRYSGLGNPDIQLRIAQGKKEMEDIKKREARRRKAEQAPRPRDAQGRFEVTQQEVDAARYPGSDRRMAIHLQEENGELLASLAEKDAEIIKLKEDRRRLRRAAKIIAEQWDD